MSFKQFQSPQQKEEKTIKRKIVYKKINEDEKFGRNIAIIAPATYGKSVMATAYGYFNSKYISHLDKDLFPYSIRLLKEGYMPEVERIVIFDLDNNFRKSMTPSKFKTLLTPLIPIIDVVEFDIPERDVEVVDGKTKSVRIEELLEAKRQVEDAAKEAINDFDENTLWIIDSLSEYYQVLDSMFSIVYEAIYDKEVGAHVKDQKDWQIRNAWWTEFMKRKRKYRGWQIDTIKAIPIPEQWIKTKTVDRSEDPFNIKWAEQSGGNAFNLDQVYRLYIDNAGFPYFNLVDGRHKSMIASENMKIYYPYDVADLSFYMIEHMAKHIIEGAEMKIENIWSRFNPPEPKKEGGITYKKVGS